MISGYKVYFVLWFDLLHTNEALYLFHILYTDRLELSVKTKREDLSSENTDYNSG